MNRKATRLHGYNYSRDGIYFVTICTYQKQCLFGDVIDGEIHLTPTGKVVGQCWLKVPLHFPCVTLDEFMIMPNHFHGLVNIGNRPSVGARHASSSWLPIRAVSLSTVIGQFKSAVTKKVNEDTNGDVVLWQRGFYDHIVRSEDSLQAIREYVVNNPAQWALDKENPRNR